MGQLSPVEQASELTDQTRRQSVTIGDISEEQLQEEIANCWFQIGDTVLVHDAPCIVRYIGKVTSKKKRAYGVYVGVEFDTPMGKNDGAVDGLYYFKCATRHGLFVRPRLVFPYVSPVIPRTGDSLMKMKTAGATLEGGHQEKEAQEAFNLWNAIDQLEEQEALTTSKDIGLVDQEMSRQLSEDEGAWRELLGSGKVHTTRQTGITLSSSSSSFSSPIISARRSSILTKTGLPLTFESLLEEPIDKNYTGPVFCEKPDMQFALSLLQHYREDVKRYLPRKLAVQLLLLMEQHLIETVPGAVVYFDIPKKPDTQLVVVGDVHGQLNDVLWLFYKFGTPSVDRTYLFNGDIADRGDNAVEIFLLLFAFKLAQPNSVIINRGNHESANMNEIYGFAEEVRLKYGSVVYRKFQDIFNLLPLCIVVEKRVLIVHGGLFRQDGVTLDIINNIDRRRACPSSPENDDDRLMFDLLWSDPCMELGRGPSGRGADCIAFGPDITEEFLRQNQLDVCIRSHQVPASLRGFDPGHDGRCITLFSASNYCGTSGNYGGVIIFDPNLMFEIQEYMAPKLTEVREVYNETRVATAKVARNKGALGNYELVIKAEQKAQQRTRRVSLINMERDMFIKMARIICERKTAIWEVLWEKDVLKDGKISATVLKSCLSDILSHNIPWDLLLNKLKAVDDKDFVHYNHFLETFRVEFRPKKANHENWRFETIQQVFESIMKADLTLKETLMVFDRNCDGTVSYREFRELLSELNFGLSEPQVRLLMRIITAHYLTTNDSQRSLGDSVIRVDVAEFLGRFKVIYGHTIKNRGDEGDPWIRQTLEVIGRYILADKAEVAQRHYQTADIGSPAPSPDEKHDKPTYAACRRRSSALRSVALFQKFKDFTVDGSEAGRDSEGFLTYKGFMNAIRKLPVAAIEAELKFKLDEDRLIRLARSIDVTGSGKINYFEFLNAFYVVDSNATTQVAEQLWQQICASFYQQKVTIRRALTHLDPEATGQVDSEEFKNALTTLNAVLGPKQAPLTEEQIDLIVNSIDSEDDNQIDYNEFLDSFVVVDVWTRQGSDDQFLDLDTSSTIMHKEAIEQDAEMSSTPTSSLVSNSSDSSVSSENVNRQSDDSNTLEREATGMLLDYLRQSRTLDKAQPILLPDEAPRHE